MTANELITTADCWVGYCGKTKNIDLDDPLALPGGLYTCFARDLWMNGNSEHYYNGNKNGFSYCCVFVDAMFYYAAGRNKDAAVEVKPTGSLGAGVKWSKGYMQDLIVEDPRPGDIVFFRSGGELCHTGIVTHVDETTISTIEGNINGPVYQHVVGEKTYKRTDNYIDSYARPRYSAEGTVNIPEWKWQKIRELVEEAADKLDMLGGLIDSE